MAFHKQMRLFAGGLSRGVSAVAVVAVVLVATVAAGAFVLYPSLTGSSGRGTTGSTLPNMNYTSTTTSFTTFSPYTTTSYFTITNSSPISPGWQEWAVANATLGYYKTQQYIHNAWNYTFSIHQTGVNPPYNETFIADYVSVLGLKVAGNWTTGYVLNYYPSELNVTVQYTPPSTYYPVSFFNARNSTSFQENIQFDATQQRAISIAMSNNTVRSYIENNMTGVFFVDDAFPFPAGNKTFGGDYLVWDFQENGPRILGVFVNMSSGTVVSTYQDSRAYRVCYSNSLCWTSPWP
jgi:hypothetical protein